LSISKKQQEIVDLLVNGWTLRSHDERDPQRPPRPRTVIIKGEWTSTVDRRTILALERAGFIEAAEPQKHAQHYIVGGHTWEEWVTQHHLTEAGRAHSTPSDRPDLLFPSGYAMPSKDI